MYSAMIFSVESERLRLMRSERRDMMMMMMGWLRIWEWNRERQMRERDGEKWGVLVWAFK